MADIAALPPAIRAELTEDATTYAKDLVESEKGLLKEQQAFVTWLVGLGSGAFLVLLNTLKDTSTRPEAHRILPVALATFGVLLASGVTFKLLAGPRRKALALDSFYFDLQLAATKGDQSTRTEKVMREPADVLEAVTMMQLVPSRVFDHWLANRSKDKRISRVAAWTYVLTVIAFLAEYGVLTIIFLRTYQ